MNDAVTFLGFSLAIGGIPYGLLAIYLAWWIRGKSEREMRRGSYLVPVLMLPVFWVCMFTYEIVESWPDVDAQHLSGGALYSPFVILLGYAYVLVVNGLLLALKKLGIVHGDSHATV